MNILKIFTLYITISAAIVLNAEDVEIPFKITTDLDLLAKENDPNALFKLAVCYQVGSSKMIKPFLLGNNPYSQDVKKSIDYYKKAAHHGSTQALEMLGDLFRDGYMVKNDYKKAISYYQKAIENGRYSSYVNWSQIYKQPQFSLIKQGILPETDDISLDSICRNKIKEYLGIAAKNNCGEAYLNLGKFYFEIDDYESAIDNFRKSMKHGCKDAWIELFNCYYHGKGCVRNKRIALEYLLEGIKSGSYPAKASLGFLLYTGDGFIQNKELGLALLSEALLMLMENPSVGTQINQIDIRDAVINSANRLAMIYSSEYKEQYPDWTQWLNINSATNLDFFNVKLQPKEFKFSHNGLDIYEDCGDWYILNSQGEQISENKYDRIEIDSISNRLFAYIGDYSVELDEVGIESYPIQEVLLDAFFSEIIPIKRIGLCQKIISLDPNNHLGYNSMAYYNIASVYYESNNYIPAYRYINQCLSLSPDFPNAVTAKSNIVSLNFDLYNEKQEEKKKEKAENRALITECIIFGANALIDAGTQISKLNKNNKIISKEAKEQIRAKNKEKVKDSRERAKKARMEMNKSVWHGALSRSYTEYVGLIENAKSDPQNYPKTRVEEIQNAMKRIREKTDIPMHENELWQVPY